MLSRIKGWEGDSLLMQSDALRFVDAKSGLITPLMGVPESLLVRPNHLALLAGGNLIVVHENDRNPPGENDFNPIEGLDFYCFQLATRSLSRVTNDRRWKEDPDLWLPPPMK
jgi:hypothetical protein